MKLTSGNTCRRTPVRSAAPGLRKNRSADRAATAAMEPPSQAAEPLPVEPGKTKSYGHGSSDGNQPLIGIRQDTACRAAFP